MCLLSWKTMSIVHACIKIMLDFFHSGIIKWELIVSIYYKVFIMSAALTVLCVEPWLK